MSNAEIRPLPSRRIGTVPEYCDLWDAHDAATYDDDLREMSDPWVIDLTVDFLASLAGSGSALEFAIGTGRVALPLRQRGVDVHGIELSEPMVDVLRAKPGGVDLPIAIGDMATVRVDGEFSLVYLVFNTMTNLLTQNAQTECFCNAAAHLAPGGAFVIETFIPQLRRLPVGERFVPFSVTPDHIGIDEYDIAAQLVTSHHTAVRADGTVDRADSHHRYAWPAEYDLMARIAGLQPAERWSTWTREPFTSESTSHISVWRKPR